MTRARRVAGLDADDVASSDLTDPQSGGLGLRPRVYDRIVRIVSLIFIAAVLISIEVANLWPETNAAILIVLGSMMLFLVLIQDVIPPSVLGRRRYVLEGIAGIGFVTALVVLTGGSSSPFFFGYFLIVAGAALWITGSTPVILALLTALAYLVGLALAPAALGGQSIATLPMVGFNLLALGLMSFLAHVVGREQRRISERALKLSRYDALTQLYYRAYFLELLEREIRRAARTGRGFCLLMLDLDDLKPINDTFGHPFGDRMLRAVGDVIRREIRASDVAARYGGDEFIVLLPETEPPGALVLAEKLRADVAHIDLRLPDRSLGTSVSIGLASFPADGTSSDQLIRTVDQAMYEAKRLGKNRIAYRDHKDEQNGDGGGKAVQAEPVPVMRGEPETTGSGPDTGSASAGGGTAGQGAGSSGSSTTSSTPGASPAASASPGGPGPVGAAPSAGPAGNVATTGPAPTDSTGTVVALREPIATAAGQGPAGAVHARAIAAPQPPSSISLGARPLLQGRPAPGPATTSVYDASEDPFGPWLRRTRAVVVGADPRTVPGTSEPVRRPSGTPSGPGPAVQAPVAGPDTTRRTTTTATTAASNVRPVQGPAAGVRASPTALSTPAAPARQAGGPASSPPVQPASRAAQALAAPSVGATSQAQPRAAGTPSQPGPSTGGGTRQGPRRAVALFGPAGTPGQAMPHTPRRSVESDRGPLTRRIASAEVHTAVSPTAAAPSAAPAAQPPADPGA